MAYVGDVLLDDGQIVLLGVAGDGPAGVVEGRRPAGWGHRPT
ncbi:hypothetical protein [Streptomyces sp. NPDC014995]